MNNQSAVSVAALVSVVVVLVPLVCRVPVAGRRHLRHDLAAELGLHRRDDLLRRLLLLLGVVKDGAPGGGERVSGRGDDGKRLESATTVCLDGAKARETCWAGNLTNLWHMHDLEK